MTAETGIGARVKRKEDQRFLTGTGRYVDDLPLARATYAYFLRSPHAHAKIIAGGHSLLPMMKLRLATPAVLIDIARIPELSYVREDDGDIAIGAATPQAAE